MCVSSRRDDIRKDDLWSPHWFVGRNRWSRFSRSHCTLRRVAERWSANVEMKSNDTSDVGYVSNLQHCQTLTPYQSLSVSVCNLPSPHRTPRRLWERREEIHTARGTVFENPAFNCVGTLFSNNPKTKGSMNHSIFITHSHLNAFCKLRFNCKSCLFAIDFPHNPIPNDTGSLSDWDITEHVIPFLISPSVFQFLPTCPVFQFVSRMFFINSLGEIKIDTKCWQSTELYGTIQYTVA